MKFKNIRDIENCRPYTDLLLHQHVVYGEVQTALAAA